MLGSWRLSVLAAGALAAGVVAFAAPAAAAPLIDNGRDYAAQAFDVLTPGEFGGVPPTANSTDQAALYDALTPLQGNVTASDLTRYYTSERFGVQGPVVRTERPRRGVVILRDRFDVPHIYGRTRDDVMFGVGWVDIEDRGLLLNEGRGPARVAVLDVPGVNAFELVKSLRTFIPSAQAEASLAAQVKLLQDSGRKGRRVFRDFQAWVAGLNAYDATLPAKARPAPWTMNDAVAAFAFIGSIFGNGGGDSVRSSDLLASLQAKLGSAPGFDVWRDLRQSNDPETPTTTSARFNYDQIPSGPTPGAAVIDPGSIDATGQADAATVASFASNALLVGAQRSVTGHPLAVMGPQLGYYYPQIFVQLDLHGGGIDASGGAPPTEPYVLTGRGKDFAWSLTTATNQNTDQFLEQLCNPDGSAPTRASTSFMYKGRCTAMTSFDAGTLKGAAGVPDREITFLQTAHGPVAGTATIHGQPYAITRQRSTRGREPLGALALADLNSNQVRSPQTFFKAANEFETTFNWFYVDSKNIAFFSSGRLPVRAPGTNPDLPTLGTGQYEWRGFLRLAQHPHAVNPKSGLILNWNNKPAPGWGAADNNWTLGSVHRVSMFTGFKRRNTLADDVSIMNRAATRDLRAVAVWPILAKVLAGGPAPSPLAQRAADLVSAWVARGASRLDRTGSGKITDPGAAVLDAAWTGLEHAVLAPVLGDSLLAKLQTVNQENDAPPDLSNPSDPGGPRHGNHGSSFSSGWYGYMSKDLRTELGQPVIGPFSRRYCGRGDITACRASLWAAIQTAATTLGAMQGPDPSAWRADATAERINFIPSLIPLTMRWTNRSSFQQVISFASHR